MAFGALYQIADGIFVGRFIGADALAAINLIMPIITIVFAFSNMIATGASVRISVLLGEQKREEASRVFTFTIKAITALSVVIGILGFAFAEPFVRLISPGASEGAIANGITYLRMYAAFSPLLLVFFATDNFLRICGKVQLSMWIGIASQGLNVLLNLLLIVFMGQGVWAAAFTSCLAMALGSVVTLALFRKQHMDLYYIGGNIPAKAFGRLLINGSSECFSNISMSIMAVVFNLFLLKYGGTTGVAAFSLIMYVDSIVGMLMFGMCDSLQPAISYCHGAKLYDKVAAIFKRVILGAVILSAISLLFMMFAGQYVAPFFVKPGDTALLAMSISGMKLFALSYLTGWVDVCFSSYFTALEHPGRSLITSFFGTLVFPILFLALFAPLWGMTGIWLTAIAASLASSLLTLVLAFTLKGKYGTLKEL